MINQNTTLPKESKYLNVRQYTIGIDENGQRVDNFLIAQYKNVPKGRIYRMIRSGEVRVNKGRVKAMYKLSKGDLVRLPPCYIEEKSQKNLINTTLINEIEANILFEDEYLAVIDKPHGVAVHGGSNMNGLVEMLQQTEKWKNCELSHRLDKDTSGCLLIAKRKSILRDLHQQFRLHQVTKFYQAIVHGKWSIKNKLINEPLLRYLMSNGERRVKVDSQGQSSQTLIEIERELESHTLIKLQPKSGRTHQLRVHCQWAKHPILGDEKYGDREKDKSTSTKLSRLALHASEITFKHPIKEHKISVEAPLPKAFQTWLSNSD